MTKREEIREGIKKKRKRILDDLAIFLTDGEVSAYSVLLMLSQHDVVIKVEGDFPNQLDENVLYYDEVKDAISEYQGELKRAGYVRTEPLVGFSAPSPDRDYIVGIDLAVEE